MLINSGSVLVVGILQLPRGVFVGDVICVFFVGFRVVCVFVNRQRKCKKGLGPISKDPAVMTLRAQSTGTRAEKFNKHEATCRK